MESEHKRWSHTMPNRQNVKSDIFEATDLQEREKDFLNEAELEKLFEDLG